MRARRPCGRSLWIGVLESGRRVGAAQELEGLEAELGAAVQAGQADAFVHYLHGLVLSDRRAPRLPPHNRPAGSAATPACSCLSTACVV